jgi:hypothetical protein
MPSPSIAAAAAAMPTLDAEAQRRADEARRIQLAQGLAGAPAGAAARTAQAVAPAVVAATAQENVQQTAQAQQQQAAAGQLAVQQAGRVAGESGARAEMSQREQFAKAGNAQLLQESQAERALKTQMSADDIAAAKRAGEMGRETESRISFLTQQEREDLSKLGSDVKQQLFDSRLQFERGELGRKFSNEHQLMDFALVSAENQEDLANKVQVMQQAQARDLQMMEVAAARIDQMIKNNFADLDRELDQAGKQKIFDMKAALNRQIERQRRRGQVMANVLQGTIAGAGTGAAVTGGNPFGAIIGGVAGGATGYAASQKEEG